jgi:hypothetical protein
VPASSLDSRRVAIAGAVAALAAGLVILGADLGSSDPAPDRGATPNVTVPDSAATGQPPTVPESSAPASGDGDREGHGDAAISADDLDAAKATAVEFAVGFSTYRFDEPPDAPLERVRHLLTDALAASLGDNSGATAERERLADWREIAEAELDSVITGGFDADHVLLNVVVAQRVTSTQGAVDQLLAYQVSLIRAGDGWRITGVAIS